MRKKLSLKEMEEIAREATRKALVGRPAISEEMKQKLVLGSGMEGIYGEFELYVTGERPQDAKVLTRAMVNSLTGEVTVEVFI